MRKLLLLRPEPGLSASSDRAREMGLEVIACPLFRVEPVGWRAPDPAAYDALLLTSANAIRHGGPELARFKSLPVHAVGDATAAAARQAGLRVVTTGEGGVADLLGSLAPGQRLLHLAGQDFRDLADPHVERIIVYRSAPIDQPALPRLAGMVVAVHSPRAGRRLAELAEDRGRTVIAAISAAAAEACGGGWERIEIADAPSDTCLLALAARLCNTSSPK